MTNRAPKAKLRTEPPVSALLLAWYDRSRRDLPWRYAPGVKADPYRVWLSEIMLQQTTVKAVAPYFEAFTRRWPTVRDLAAAPLDDLLAAWAGLGYYARARNMHACAGVVAHEHAGRFPADEAALLALPGVGPYTAAAIAAIGHGLKATPVDGNVERVVSRLFAVRAPLPAAKALLREHAQALTPDLRAGDFAQAMMDLGATVCTPKSPSCLICPISDRCAARALDIAADLPAKAAKPERPVRYGIAFVVEREDGAVLLRRRPETGLLGGMTEVPSTDWLSDLPGGNAVRQAEPVDADFVELDAAVVHVFTHFRLELRIQRARLTRFAAGCVPPSAGRFVARDQLDGEALPTVMRKVLVAAGLLAKTRPRRM
jgi:A/G-specific adenine glycosylase